MENICISLLLLSTNYFYFSQVHCCFFVPNSETPFKVMKSPTTANTPTMVGDTIISVEAQSGRMKLFAHGSKFFFVKESVDNAASRDVNANAAVDRKLSALTATPTAATSSATSSALNTEADTSTVAVSEVEVSVTSNITTEAAVVSNETTTGATVSKTVAPIASGAHSGAGATEAAADVRIAAADKTEATVAAVCEADAPATDAPAADEADEADAPATDETAATTAAT